MIVGMTAAELAACEDGDVVVDGAGLVAQAHDDSRGGIRWGIAGGGQDYTSAELAEHADGATGVVSQWRLLLRGGVPDAVPLVSDRPEPMPTAPTFSARGNALWMSSPELPSPVLVGLATDPRTAETLETTLNAASVATLPEVVAERRRGADLAAELRRQLQALARRDEQARSAGVEAVGELLPSVTTGGDPGHVIGLLADEVRALRAAAAKPLTLTQVLGVPTGESSAPTVSALLTEYRNGLAALLGLAELTGATGRGRRPGTPLWVAANEPDRIVAAVRELKGLGRQAVPDRSGTDPDRVEEDGR